MAVGTSFGMVRGAVNITASTFTVGPESVGVPLTLSAVAGTSVTLPTSTGSGARILFLVAKALTSGSHVIRVNGATDLIQGNTQNIGASTYPGFIAAATDNTLTLNGTTTGAKAIGDYIEFIDAVAGVWFAHAFVSSSGTPATPFSTT